MLQTFIVDQAATFQAVAFLSAEPRLVFGSRDKQEMTKDGVPRWDVQVIAGFRDNFGKVNNEVVTIGYAGPKNPAESIGMYQPVQLVNFTVGVMEKTAKDDKNKVIGFRVWYRCDEVRPTSAPAPSGK
ncbi:hypothetical protein [Micromonospora sp. NPDC050695]|uniref:hypothetical protein n=1 Tax=Micromonospora sp. NPDC050695 TaxID=3154938 RepID=UPI0033C8E0D1